MNIKENILYEDKDIIVCIKKSGWLSQSDRSFDVDMASALMSWRVGKGEPPYIAILNRLDRPVSGIVLFAKTKEMAAKLSKALINNHINKYYYAVVCGKLPEEKGTFVDYLVKDARSNTSRVAASQKEGKEAKLEYEVLAVNESDQGTYSLVRIHLITGRHHQIRVQFASRGLALLGDAKYNPNYVKTADAAGIALCAYRMEVLGKNFEILPEGGGFEMFEAYFENKRG